MYNLILYKDLKDLKAVQTGFKGSHNDFFLINF